MEDPVVLRRVGREVGTTAVDGWSNCGALGWVTGPFDGIVDGPAIESSGC